MLTRIRIHTMRRSKEELPIVASLRTGLLRDGVKYRFRVSDRKRVIKNPHEMEALYAMIEETKRYNEQFEVKLPTWSARKLKFPFFGILAIILDIAVYVLIKDSINPHYDIKYVTTLEQMCLCALIAAGLNAVLAMVFCFLSGYGIRKKLTYFLIYFAVTILPIYPYAPVGTYVAWAGIAISYIAHIW